MRESYVGWQPAKIISCTWHICRVSHTQADFTNCGTYQCVNDLAYMSGTLYTSSTTNPFKYGYGLVSVQHLAQGSIIRHYDNLIFQINSMFSTQKYIDAPFLIILGKWRPVQQITWCTQFPSAHLWHNKLGHPTFSRISLLHFVEPDVVVVLANKPLLCLSTSKADETFVSSKWFFYLIHCDIWGPFPTITINGLKYLFDHCK